MRFNLPLLPMLFATFSAVASFQAHGQEVARRTCKPIPLRWVRSAQTELPPPPRIESPAPRLPSLPLTPLPPPTSFRIRLRGPWRGDADITLFQDYLLMVGKAGNSSTLVLAAVSSFNVGKRALEVQMCGGTKLRLEMKTESDRDIVVRHLTRFAPAPRNNSPKRPAR